MNLNDPELAEIIRSSTPVEINNQQFTIEPNKRGSCDGCYFERNMNCPQQAVTFCTSNGGNVLKLVEPNK